VQRFLRFVIVAFLTAGSAARAGLPDLTRSSCGIEGLAPGCTVFRFASSDTTWDVLTCNVTLRDTFDTPVAFCSTSASLSFSAGGATFPFGCFCTAASGGTSTLRLAGVSNADGVVRFVIGDGGGGGVGLGGNGQLDLRISAHCIGDLAVCEESVQFTSPDLSGSCEASPASTMDITDLAIWGASQGTPYADTTCDGVTDISDLGAMGAHGAGMGCR
jgi:hypothetical protein